MFEKSRNLSKKCSIFRTSTPRRSRSNVGLDGQRKQFADQQDVLPVDRRYFAQEERRGNAIIKKRKNPNKYQNLKQDTSNWSSDQNKSTRQDRQKRKTKRLRTSACKNKTKTHIKKIIYTKKATHQNRKIKVSAPRHAKTKQRRTSKRTFRQKNNTPRPRLNDSERAKTMEKSNRRLTRL